MKNIIKERNDDKVSLVELSPGKIYGVSMNYVGNGGNQVDIMIVKSVEVRNETKYRFESMIVGSSYMDNYDELQDIISECLNKPRIYQVYEFDDLLDFFQWAALEAKTLIEKLKIEPSSLGRVDI